MKNIAVLFLPIIVLIGCDGKAFKEKKEIKNTSEIRQLDSFSELTVSNSIELIMEKGNENVAKIETEGVDVSDVLLDVSGLELKIKMASSINSFWDFGFNNDKVKIRLTYVEDINSIEAQNSTSVIGLTSLNTDQFELKVRNSAKTELEINANNVTINVSNSAKANLIVSSKVSHTKISNSGKLNIKGNTKRQTARISNSGRLNAFAFKSDTAQVKVSNSGLANISVSNTLDGYASNSGEIAYQGSPENITVKTNNSGDIYQSK
ncbi:MAG: DUF2807 domain-containing protein [Reichenbachiella sp.]